MKITVILFLMFLAGPTFAQNKNWESDWNQTLAAAKKEGQIVVAGSPDLVMRREVIPKFTARYGIEVEYLAGRSSRIAARVRTERDAGLSTVDVFMAGIGTTTRVLYKEKLIQPLRPMLILPDVVDGSKWKIGELWFADPEKKYVFRAFNRLGSFGFINTDYVKPNDIRAAKDLLDPKWKGKIAVDDPTVSGTGSNTAAQFLMQFGEEFIKRLYVDQKPGVTRNRRQLADWLARGTYPICLNCRDGDLKPLKKAGFNVYQIFEVSDMEVQVGGTPWWLSVATDPPNPNAQKIFANWIVSKEALQTYSQGYGNATLRTDVDESFLNPKSIPRPGVKYFDSHEWNWAVSGRRKAQRKAAKLLKGLMNR